MNFRINIIINFMSYLGEYLMKPKRALGYVQGDFVSLQEQGCQLF